MLLCVSHSLGASSLRRDLGGRLLRDAELHGVRSIAHQAGGAMKHPIHHVNECPDCNGEAGTYQDDWDSEAPRMVWVACEGCANSGQVTSCDRCDEVMALPEAELLGYVCGPCRADVEMGDARAEARRISRWVA